MLVTDTRAMAMQESTFNYYCTRIEEELGMSVINHSNDNAC